MEIVYRRDPLKALRRLQPAKAADIRSAIARIAVDPSAPNNNIKRLSGVPDGYRVRVGDWRVSYTLDRQKSVLEIYEIAPRGGAYR